MVVNAICVHVSVSVLSTRFPGTRYTHTHVPNEVNRLECMRRVVLARVPMSHHHHHAHSMSQWRVSLFVDDGYGHPFSSISING